MQTNGAPKSPINALANGHSPAASERLQIINDEKKFTSVVF
jgi:hypothetical protein